MDSDVVLGLPDEVKTIAFFVNDTTDTNLEIRISRRYGLVEAVNFFDFLVEHRTLVLAGRSDPAAGVQRPPAAAYGNAEVGDTFQLRTYTGSTHNSLFYGAAFGCGSAPPFLLRRMMVAASIRPNSMRVWGRYI